MPAVEWPHVLQWCSCHGVAEETGQDGAAPTLPAAAAVPAAPIPDFMAATTTSPHLFSFPPAASQAWLPGLMRRWMLARDEGGEGQAAPDTDFRGRGCIAVWGWTILNPRSEVRLLLTQESQQCTALFKLQWQKPSSIEVMGKFWWNEARRRNKLLKFIGQSLTSSFPAWPREKGKGAVCTPELSFQRSHTETVFWRDSHKLNSHILYL